MQKPVAKATLAWPPVHVLMAVHNEERVLPQKLVSLARQDYPGHLNILIGSDRSSDGTDSLLKAFILPPGDRRTYVYHLNAERRGKPETINYLARRAGTEGIFVLTDASVILQPDTITELVRPLIERPELAVVDSCMVHTEIGVGGIGASENDYINLEVRLKQAEGEYYGYLIGPFGGCWAIRAEAFVPVPANYLVDDFFLCMNAYRAGWRGMSSERAVVFEGVGQRMDQEFRRKVRIGSGNWQNLVHFRDLWWPAWRGGLAFAFFSHKVLRWLTPLLLILTLACLTALWVREGNNWAEPLLIMAIGLPTIIVVVDAILNRFGIHFRPLRNLNYFIAMNAALVVGFLRFITGIKSNVWQPSHRPQSEDR